MDSNTFLLVMRGAERLADVVVAGLLVWLGYRLFTKLPTELDATGKVVLPGGVSIFLSRVGPGAFFALFGAVVLVYSIITQVKVVGPDGKETQYAIQPAAPATSGTLPQLGDEHFAADLTALDLTGDLAEGIMSGKSEPKVSYDLAARLANSLPRIKAGLILLHWQDSWGDRTAFYEWVKTGAKAPPPVGLSPRVLTLLSAGGGGQQ